MIRSKILLDSINIFGNRATTVIAEFPRMVLAELNTHKMISKNSASSRAIPSEKMLQRVKEDPFIPIKWMKDHSGMQGNKYFTDEEAINDLRYNWLQSRDNAVSSSIHLNNLGLTKQITNRLLEPFLWHKALLSATEWENFFALRAEGMAEIHIQALAHNMLDRFNENTPKLIKPGEWHLPYGENIDEEVLNQISLSQRGEKDEIYMSLKLINRLRIVTARCARTSYNNFDGTSDMIKDIEMAENRIIKPGHWSPTEHPMLSMNEGQFYNHAKEFEIPKASFEEYESKNNIDWYEVVAERENKIVIKEFGWSKNVRGWIQYRSLFMDENRQEPRLIKK